jgi:ribonuclease HI
LVLVWNKIAKHELEWHEEAHARVMKCHFSSSENLMSNAMRTVAYIAGTPDNKASEVGKTTVWHNPLEGVTHLDCMPPPPGATDADLQRMPSEDARACACGDSTWAFPNGFGRAKAHADSRVGHMFPRVPIIGNLEVLPVDEACIAGYGTPEHLASLPLRFDWRAMFYTDGSSHTDSSGQNYTGSGVVLPARNETPAKTYLVAPGGRGVSNTVNRAELAAIHAALGLMAQPAGPSASPPATTPGVICTDSACSLSLIRRALRDPNSLKFHKHGPMLTSITSRIKQVALSHGPIQLIKCKAHSGIVGNELADEAAKKAAKYNATHDLTCTDVAPHPFGGGMYWVAEKNDQDGVDTRQTAATEGQHTMSPLAVGEGTVDEPDAEDEPRYLSNLRKDLDKCVKARCCVGAAATAPGFYAQAWEGVRKSTLSDISNAFATTAPLAQRRTAWATRAGVLMNKKLEQRWFKRGDGNCPLCGQPDSCMHIASGCPKLSGLYTERHNRAARILVKAILKGSLGANIIQADIGSADKLARAGMTLSDAHRYIPKDRLPADVANNPEAYGSLSRPDATLTRDYPPQLEVVEVKVCRDTDRSVQLERAEKQHTELISHMRRTRATVQLNTFAFGATGTIYTDNLDQMVKLGVDRASAKKALRKIHNSLVHDLHTIVCTRRAQERLAGTTTAGSTRNRPPTQLQTGRCR